MTTWYIILIAWLAPALILVAVGLYMRFKAHDRSHHQISDAREGEELPDPQPGPLAEPQTLDSL